jgi:outer membrane biosynthesis protein TonB
MRAGNKGRSLRPRTSPSRNSSLPPESDLATGEGHEDAAAAPVSADPETLPALRGAPPAEPAAEVVAPAKITPAEVLAAGEAFSNLGDDEEDEDEVPVAKVEAAVSVKKVEPVVVAKKADEPKKAEPVVVAKKVEPIAAVIAGKKNEPVVVAKKSEPAPVSSQNRKSEPVKAAEPKKVDENAQAQRTPAADVDLRSGNKKKGGKNEGAKAEAKRPTNDEVDDSSISAEFFRREGDSLPPMVDAHGEHDDHDEAAGTHLLSAATMARRARLRRVVAGVVAFAGVITLAVVGKTLAASKQPATSMPMKPPVTQEARVEPKPEEKAPPPPVKPAEAVPVAVVAPTASADVAKVEPDPKADAKAAEDAKKAADDAKKAEEPKKVEASGGDVKALTKEAESFLNRGNRKDSMAKAREAIAADPSEAMAYLLLGSALQDSGKWKDGIEAYSECVRNATKGPVSECRQMGGHK